MSTQELEEFAARWRQDSWAQEGEDLVLRRFFEGQRQGFYVDVGAHHPCQYSNTYWFYRRSWRGINIDALPQCMDAFNAIRPEDINLELAVAEIAGESIYYMFSRSALNGFSPEISRRRDGNKDGDQIIERRPIQTHTLAEILRSQMPSGKQIDFLTVDVEGLDLSVLRSNDWERYRPRLVLSEDLERVPLDELAKSPLVEFMRHVGYRATARTFNTLFFEQLS